MALAAPTLDLTPNRCPEGTRLTRGNGPHPLPCPEGAARCAGEGSVVPRGAKTHQSPGIGMLGRDLVLWVV